MTFFDLNIPYNESSSPSSSSSSNLKTTRIKIATKAMELGYSGIAYNRTIKGVMSDHDRCSISFLSFSSLQKLLPSLSRAVDFHRDLLKVTRSSPFRQYTRLTVCADSVAQAQVLNSGNSVIKTYDLVAVRPMNQSAFDYACEKSEVDVISIDFSVELPFRLKLPMVKAAIERGVCFEIIYSDLIGEIQVRRQMIANAKLLVDWTRGRNLILASAAPSVNELRGPYDVANLLSVIGVSMEHAKAAISKNCRTLIANALQKKHFYKDTVRVEAIPSFGSKEPSSVDVLEWNPISSGDGDLLLEDMAKSFAATTEVSNTLKATNFASISETHGFQVKDLLSAPKISSQFLNNGKNCLSAQVREMSVQTGAVSKHGSMLNILHQIDQALPCETNSRCHTSSCKNSSKLGLPSNNTDVTSKETVVRTAVSEEQRNISRPEASDKVIETELHGVQLQKCISSELDAELVNKNVHSDMELDAAINDVTVTEKNSTPHTTSTVKESKNINNLDEYPSNKFDIVLGRNKMACETSSGHMHLYTADSTLCADMNVSNSLNEESENSDVTLVEQNAMVIDVNVEADKIDLEDVKDCPSVADHEPLVEALMVDTKHGQSDSNTDLPTLVPCISGKSRAKQRKKHRRVLLYPSKLLLTNPIPFKKKIHKVKSKTKKVGF